MQIANIDEQLSQLHDALVNIDERRKNRQDKYLRSTQDYLKSIKKEIEVIDQTKQSHELRNNEFREQIRNVYLRYQSAQYPLVQKIRRTTEERLRFNEWLTSVLPSYSQQKKQDLLQKQKKLEKRLNELRTVNQRENTDFGLLNLNYKEDPSIKDANIAHQKAAQMLNKANKEIDRPPQRIEVAFVKSEDTNRDDYIQQMGQRFGDIFYKPQGRQSQQASQREGYVPGSTNQKVPLAQNSRQNYYPQQSSKGLQIDEFLMSQHNVKNNKPVQQFSDNISFPDSKEGSVRDSMQQNKNQDSQVGQVNFGGYSTYSQNQPTNNQNF